MPVYGGQIAALRKSRQCVNDYIPNNEVKRDSIFFAEMKKLELAMCDSFRTILSLVPFVAQKTSQLGKADAQHGRQPTRFAPRAADAGVRRTGLPTGNNRFEPIYR